METINFVFEEIEVLFTYNTESSDVKLSAFLPDKQSSLKNAVMEVSHIDKYGVCLGSDGTPVRFEHYFIDGGFAIKISVNVLDRISIFLRVGAEDTTKGIDILEDGKLRLNE